MPSFASMDAASLKRLLASSDSVMWCPATEQESLNENHDLVSQIAAQDPTTLTPSEVQSRVLPYSVDTRVSCKKRRLLDSSSCVDHDSCPAPRTERPLVAGLSEYTTPIANLSSEEDDHLKGLLESISSAVSLLSSGAKHESPMSLDTFSFDVPVCQAMPFASVNSTERPFLDSADDLSTVFDNNCSMFALPELGGGPDVSFQGVHQRHDQVVADDEPSEPDDDYEPLPLGIVPTPADVLGGKGGRTVDHNLFYTQLCAGVASDYASTVKRGWSGKKGIALKVVTAVKAKGGRFLMPGPAGWEQLDDEKAVDKAAHCIRDAIGRRRKGNKISARGV